MAGGKKLVRPQTAATTTKKDEERIKKQLRYLEQIESKIEDDIDIFQSQRGIKKKETKGQPVTK